MKKATTSRDEYSTYRLMKLAAAVGEKRTAIRKQAAAGSALKGIWKRLITRMSPKISNNTPGWLKKLIGRETNIRQTYMHATPADKDYVTKALRDSYRKEGIPIPSEADISKMRSPSSFQTSESTAAQAGAAARAGSGLEGSPSVDLGQAWEQMFNGDPLEYGTRMVTRLHPGKVLGLGAGAAAPFAAYTYNQKARSEKRTNLIKNAVIISAAAGIGIPLALSLVRSAAGSNS